MQKKAEYINIHLLRIIACIMVILIHISATPVTTLLTYSPPYFLFLILGSISYPSVPLFLSISGFLLWKKYESQKESPKFLPFIKKHLLKLIVFYTLWSLAYYSIYAIKGNYPISSVFILKGLAFGTFSYHLYFMIILFQCYLVYPALDFIIKRLGIKITLGACIILQLFVTLNSFNYSDRALPTYIGYFVMGIVMANSKLEVENYKNKFIKSIVFFFIWSVAYVGFILHINLGTLIPAPIIAFTHILFLYLAILILFHLSAALAQFPQIKKAGKVLKMLANSTKNVYYSHPLMLSAVLVLCSKFEIRSISFRAILSLIAILGILFPLIYLTETKRKKRHS